MRASLLSLFLSVCLPSVALAEPLTPAVTEPSRGRFSVMAGLSQWTLVGGANVAVQYKRGLLALAYSHGQGLHLNRVSFVMSPEEREAGVDVRMPWTTGFGVGINLLRNLHLLIEVKAHRFEVRGADRNQLLEYTTFSVGPGLFYELHLWRGLFLQPSLRWWPTVASTLKEQDATLSRADGTSYVHKSHGQGVFPNVSLGWTFQ